MHTHPGQQKPAGPKGYPLLGVIPMLKKGPLQFFLNMSEQYGDIAYWNTGRNKVYFINHPDGVKHVLSDNARNYHKSLFYRHLLPVFGGGMPMLEGESWFERRKLAEPALTHNRIGQLVPIIMEQIHDLIDELESHRQTNTPVDMAATMFATALKVATATLLSSNIKSHVPTISRSLSTIFRIINNRVYSGFNLPYSFPTPTHIELKKALAALDNVLLECIKGHEIGDHHDLLAMFMNARDEVTDQGMTLKELVAETRTTLIAAHETTASALAWTFFLLARHPDVERKLRKEIDSVLDGRDPTFEDYQDLKYTRWVMLEALRLYPSIWVVSRTPQENDEIFGYRIPKGSIVTICPYAFHRRPQLWPEPEKFEPERFAPEASRDRSSYAYLGFGAGPRSCIGRGLALMEGVLLIATVLRRYKFDLVPEQNFELVPMIFLRSKGKILMNVHLASSVSSAAIFQREESNG